MHLNCIYFLLWIILIKHCKCFAVHTLHCYQNYNKIHRLPECYSKSLADVCVQFNPCIPTAVPALTKTFECNVFALIPPTETSGTRVLRTGNYRVVIDIDCVRMRWSVRVVGACVTIQMGGQAKYAFDKTIK